MAIKDNLVVTVVVTVLQVGHTLIHAVLEIVVFMNVSFVPREVILRSVVGIALMRTFKD